MENIFCYESPIGHLILTANETAITGLSFSTFAIKNKGKLTAELKKCITQLDEYFQGKRKSFDLNLEPKGTPFQKACWEELKKIPYGETVSYGHIAKSLSNPKAVRAVGGANHNNPIAIMIPCHRVIGANGKMTGYGGEIWRKEFLLNLEKGKL